MKRDGAAARSCWRRYRSLYVISTGVEHQQYKCGTVAAGRAAELVKSINAAANAREKSSAINCQKTEAINILKCYSDASAIMARRRLLRGFQQLC
jgi:hypothetical protein